MTTTAPVFTLARSVRCCLFDLDGVLTSTAALHARAWKQMFDAALARLRQAGVPGDLAPFDIGHDYLDYVDGRPRFEGIRTFLGARGIDLPEGDAEADDDEADDGDGGERPEPALTIASLGRDKNAIFRRLLEQQGVEVIDANVAFLRRARRAGRRCAVVTSSANGKPVLRSAGLDDEVDLVVDGLVAKQAGLRGKPAPDTFLHAAQAFGCPPAAAAVFEDAVAGVAAGRAGGFGVVVGVGDGAHATELSTAGATVVVPDLAGLGIEGDD